MPAAVAQSLSDDQVCKNTKIIIINYKLSNLYFIFH